MNTLHRLMFRIRSSIAKSLTGYSLNDIKLLEMSAAITSRAICRPDTNGVSCLEQYHGGVVRALITDAKPDFAAVVWPEAQT